ncbi:MAG: putative DNA binding protein [Natrialbaceae archaeon]|jgi:predicted DNA binding protein
MSRAVLTLAIPADVWIGAVSRNHPEAQFRVLAATTNEDGGVALAEVIDDDDQRILHDIESANSVTAVEVLEKDDETLLLEIETQTAMFLDFARRAGVPIKTPFSVQDGEVIWELTASRHRLSSLNETLTDAGITFTVESIYQEVDSEQLLTERQWTIIQTALEEGYYDTPRTCTQEDIARNVGLAKSTCSELLHRAEEAIIKRLVGAHIESSAGKSKQQPIIV